MTKIKDRVVYMETSDDGEEEKTIEKKDGQKMSTLKPQLTSIFSEIEQNLPSIDFDFGDVSSDSDISDEPLIFHRNLKSSDYLLDEDKDLDTSFSGENLSDKTKELSPVKDNNSLEDENCADLEKDASENETGFPGNARQTATNITSTPASVHEEKEHVNIIDKNEEIFSEFLCTETPVLPLNVFENIDLDSVLSTLTEDNQYGPPRTKQAWLEPQPVISRSGSGDSNSSEEMTLIEKLAQLSVKQGAIGLSDINPQTGATSQDNRANYSQADSKGTNTNSSNILIPDVEPVKKTCSMGTNTSDLSSLPVVTIKPLYSVSTNIEVSKSDTIFIDLRGFEKHCQEERQNMERVQAILQLQNNRNNEESSDSEDETSRWIEERRKIKDKLISYGVSAETSANKPKSLNSKASYKQPQRVINMLERTTASSTDDITSNRPQKTQIDEKTRQKELATQLEKERQLEVARKIREVRVKEHEHRIRLAQRLEAIKPTSSVSGLQSTAEATPTLYHMEASFEPATSTLPRILSPDQTCLLLKIHLACNGEIISHKNRTKQSVDTGEGLSASYTTLLTWLTSLVPDDFTYLQRTGTDKQTNEIIRWQPFYVIGLQQIWLEEKLYLTVAITPTEQFDPKLIQSIKSKKYQGGNPFMQYIHNFLTGHSLHTVCPWLHGLVSVEVEGLKRDGSESKPYIYRPPLPNVTEKTLASFMEVHQDSQAAFRIFKMAVGFYWQTVDTDEGIFDQVLDNKTVDYETQNTMSLVYKKIYRNPGSLMGIMIRILQEGLDLAGVRLLYPTAEMLNLPSSDGDSIKSDTELLNNIGPVLALAIRGTFARSIWLDAIGPSDPVLARRTDPNSLCAQFGGESRDESLLFCPRNSTRVLSEITRWFAGRIPASGCIHVGQPYKRKEYVRSGSPKSRKGKKCSLSEKKLDFDDIPTQRPLATLTATTKSDLFLVVSPLVPPSAVGILIATCQRRGFQVRGVRRLRLSSKRAETLGISSEDRLVFCGESIDQSNNYPSNIYLLEKENSSHNAASLIEALMVQLTLKGLMNDIQKRYYGSLDSKQLFYAATFTSDLLASLGGDFSQCPNYDTLSGPSYIQPTLYSNAELEQIVIVVLHGYNIHKSCGLFIGQLLNATPYSKTPVISPLSEGMELLGIKWLPSLTASQAKEVTPIEVGDKMWKESIHRLTSEPAIVLALRGVDAFKQLESMVPPGILNQPNKTPLHKLMSHTAEEAYTFARLFFNKQELFIDNEARRLLPYLPEYLQYQNKRSNSDLKEDKKSVVNIFEIMKCGPRPIRTFLLIKPCAMKKHSLAKLLKKIVQEGFKVVGLRLEVLNEERAALIIQSLNFEDKESLEKQKLHLTSGPSMYLCLERENAVHKLVEIIGPSNPQSARRKSQFLWRGIFGSDSIANGLHGSINYCMAVEELSLFFTEKMYKSNSNQQDDIVEDILIDVEYKSHRHINIFRGEQSLLYEHSKMADIHASLLLQTNCLLLSPPLLALTPKSKSSGYVEVIDSLQSHGFEIVGARMLCLNQNQAEQYLCLLDAGSFKQVPILLMGPCIILAVQRDNAVIACNSIFESTINGDAMLKKFKQLILKCSTVNQAERLLPFFFDKLMPESQVTITTKTTT